jgi:hypothetical protein
VYKKTVSTTFAESAVPLRSFSIFSLVDCVCSILCVRV